MKKKLVSLLLCAAVAVSMAAGCGDGKPAAAPQEEGAQAAQSLSGGDSKYEEFLTVDVFDSQANYQGIQSGWFAKIVKDKFNMELNIIAPNVAGGGDTLFQTRSAAGNLGDLIFTSADRGRLQDLVTAGLVMDMSGLIQGKENLERYREAIEYSNKELVEEEGIYMISSEVTTLSPTTPMEGTDCNSGVYLRWDLYQELGCPELNTAEDMLAVLKEMQELCPVSDSGKKTYAFSLFKDWDDNAMKQGAWLPSLYGYRFMGDAVYSADDSLPPQSLVEDDSVYVRNLKLFFTANQMGLMDPESTTQNYDTLYSKYKDGAVLFSPWPWLGQAAYNVTEHVEEGKGFMAIPVADTRIYSWGCYAKGNPANSAMIGSKAQDPQRMADFIDWLYSPEGIGNSAGHSVTLCGPEGLTWERKDGAPVLTEFGRQCLVDGDAQMPEEYGGGSWKDGKSQLGIKAISSAEINPETNHPYDYTLWDSYTELNSNPLIEDWQEHYGVKTAVEYYKDHGQVLVAPGCSYSEPAEDSEIATIRTQINSTVVEYSWKAVFAKDEAEFKEYIRQMQETVYGLGYERILEIDMQKVEDQKAERQKVLQ